jgi:hypothetical protein
MKQGLCQHTALLRLEEQSKLLIYLGQIVLGGPDIVAMHLDNLHAKGVLRLHGIPVTTTPRRSSASTTLGAVVISLVCSPTCICINTTPCSDRFAAIKCTL